MLMSEGEARTWLTLSVRLGALSTNRSLLITFELSLTASQAISSLITNVV